jgi:pimeloyl-ACP methyl ester carboxylesterase
VSPLDYDAGVTMAGRGPAIVLVPGIDGTGRLFYRQVPRLAKRHTVNSFPHYAPQLRLLVAIAVLGAMPWGAMATVRRATASRMHSRHTHGAEVSPFLELSSGIRRDGYVNRLRVLREYDVRARLREIRSPTLFLASEQDRLVPSVAQAHYMAARVPGASLQVLEGHGHICLIAPGVDLAALIAPVEAQVRSR